MSKFQSSASTVIKKPAPKRNRMRHLNNQSESFNVWRSVHSNDHETRRLESVIAREKKIVSRTRNKNSQSYSSNQAVASLIAHTGMATTTTVSDSADLSWILIKNSPSWAHTFVRFCPKEKRLSKRVFWLVFGVYLNPRRREASWCREPRDLCLSFYSYRWSRLSQQFDVLPEALWMDTDKENLENPP